MDTPENTPKPFSKTRPADQKSPSAEQESIPVSMADVLLIGQALIGEGRFYYANNKRGLGSAKAFAGEMILKGLGQLTENKIEVVGPEAMPPKVQL